MNILSFKKMRAYRSDGKIIAILSIALPRCEEEDLVGKRFTGFYNTVFERLTESCEKIQKRPGITKISVEFELISAEAIKLRPREKKKYEHLIAIKRITTVRTKEERFKTEAIDIFDSEAGVFIR